MVQKIKGIPIHQLDINDTPIWGLTPSGDFYVKLATWLAHDIPKNIVGFGISISHQKSRYFCGKFAIKFSLPGKHSLEETFYLLMCALFVTLILNLLITSLSSVQLQNMFGHSTIQRLSYISLTPP